MFNINQKTPSELTREVAQRVKTRRKEMKLTQMQVAERAGMSLASYRRFEQKGLVAFHSLAAIAIALDCEDDFDSLFARKAYASIDEVIAATRAYKKTGIRR